MGGYAGGAEASRIVLEKLQRKIKSMCFRGDDETDTNLEDTVARAIRVAALDMVRAARTNSSFRKMGTVFSLAYIVNGTLLWTHVGDSRIYLYRENQLHQLTKDETYVQKMVDSHQLSADEVRHHPMRNIVTNAISTRFQHALPVVRSLKLQDNDVVVLTTDGITDMLLPVEIKNLLNLHDEPQAAADAIVKSAIEEGSRDNCTCVVVRVDQLGTIES
jgi:protein phosphatase